MNAAEMETELVHTEAGAAVDDPEAVPPVLYEVGEIIDFARKFADLICVDFQHDQVTYWELMSKKFRYCPSDDPDDGLYPVRCIVDGNGHVKLRILNFVAREANWFTERTDAEVIIRSLSYYGHRHRFCPGKHPTSPAVKMFILIPFFRFLDSYSVGPYNNEHNLMVCMI